MNRRFALKAVSAALALSAATSLPAWAQSTIKVGVLHSLSGTMAISETVLKDTVLMAIDEINASGGVLGKKLEPVVVDPASNWPLFAEKARQLITQDKVAAVFGCWTSVSRKSVLPVFEELNGVLFYPVQYEGEESERNVFYTGAAPNQQAIPAVDYLMKDKTVKRWVLAGTATVLAVAREAGHACYALSFDYGERHRVELEAARRVAESLGAVQHRVVKLDIGWMGGSALTDPQLAVPDRPTTGIPITYVPERNTVFLSIALGWAEVLEAKDISIGVNALD